MESFEATMDAIIKMHAAIERADGVAAVAALNEARKHKVAIKQIRLRAALGAVIEALEYDMNLLRANASLTTNNGRL